MVGSGNISGKRQKSAAFPLEVSVRVSYFTSLDNAEWRCDVLPALNVSPLPFNSGNPQ